MNKLNPEDLHLLIDEPIYVLNEHIHQLEESKDEVKVEEPVVEMNTRASTKEILVISENSISPEDEEFLFKGLNALDIVKDNVSILDSIPSTSDKTQLSHKKAINFYLNPDKQKSYKVIDSSEVLQLECHLLSTIRNDQDLKVKFWLSLKSLFA